MSQGPPLPDELSVLLSDIAYTANMHLHAHDLVHLLSFHASIGCIGGTINQMHWYNLAAQ